MSERIVNVLVVENNAGSRWVAERILREGGHTVTSCENGAVALHLCHELGYRFDVILLNARMPLLDGAETARRLREHPMTATVPIVGVSAFEAISDADTNVFKPYRKAELLEAVANTIHIRKSN